ncbi:MAG: OFA family MFS transporter [Clostridiales bacterium]|nr:OFA family MFS transporter [Clostridiales bacterium]
MEKSTLQSKTSKWTVLWSAVGVSVILGILYVWSVISKGLMSEFGWTSTQASLPYTIFTCFMAMAFFVSGRIQDKIGPRKCIVATAILMGAGLIISGLFTTPWLVALGFGVICGAGVGTGNVSSLAPALKWFPASKKGMVSGTVLAGIGLSAVIYAPLSNLLIHNIGTAKTFLIYGTISLVFMLLLSRKMVNPPTGYNPETGSMSGSAEDLKATSAAQNNPKSVPANNLATREMLKTFDFYKLFILLALSSSSGLMIIGHAAKIAQLQAGWQGGFLLVIILSLFNTLGRFLGGSISDIFGRINTMKLIFLVQAVNMLCFGLYTTIPTLIIGIMVAGFCYGTIFSVFPSTTADFYGLKNFGANYGCVFLAWGIGGVIGPMTAARIVDTTGAYNSAYIVACALTILALAITFTFKKKAAATNA